MADDIIVDVCTDRRDTVVDANTERPGHPRVCAGGQTGAYSTFEIVETVTGAPGSAAKAENLGTKTAVKLKLTIPQGMTGVGKTGPKGEPGYTPQKNVDYFDGVTPVKGIDYFTPEEKAKMVEEVIESTNVKTYADAAAASAAAAAASEAASAKDASSASESAKDAFDSKAAAANSEAAAKNSATEAEASAEATKEAKAGAQTAEGNAAASAQAAKASESASKAAQAAAEKARDEAQQAAGGNVQPDWNQNDPTKPDYVKNRTHYEETVLETFLPETAVTVSDGCAGLGYFEQLVVGRTYVVTFNGITYECVARAYYDAVLIGNGVIYGDEYEANGEPFCCDSYPDGEIFLNTNEDGEYTISISTYVVKPHQIDPKYIADMYYDKGVVTENVLPEISVTIEDDDNGMGWAEPSESIMGMVAGDTYIVTFDGTVYECVGIDVGDVALGNIEGEEGGEPFAIWWYNASFWEILAPAGTHTISIVHLHRDFKQIDDKYLGILEDEAITVFEASNVYKDYTCDVPGLFPISGKALIYVKGVKYETEFKGDIYESEAWITLQTEEQPEVRFVTGLDYLFISGETCPDYLYDVRVDVITKKVKHSYVASDWEEDDSESSSFIKNRPGGYGGYVGAIVYRATAANTLQRTSEWNEIVPSAVLQRMPAENTGQYMLARVRETGAERLLCNAGMGTGGYIRIVDEKGKYVTSSRFSPGDVISFTTTGTYEVGKDYTVDFYVLSEIIRIPKFYLDESLADKDFVNAALADAGKVKSVNGMVGDVVIESDVFYATYGTTTTAELEAALTAGKAVYCKNGAYIARFLRKNGAATRHVFGYRDTEYLCDSDTWSTSVVKFSPASHAETHAANGSDPITPADIGAATTEYVDNAVANAVLITVEDIDTICTPVIITFTIDNMLEFQAEEGMTWEEWVNSDYNNASDTQLVVSADGYIWDTMSYVDLGNGTRVTASDVIVEGYNYYLTGDDAGDDGGI